LFRFRFRFLFEKIIILKQNTKDEDLERIYLDNLPAAENYEKSYMHRDTITHLIVTW
jgi:hypothetical protein